MARQDDAIDSLFKKYRGGFDSLSALQISNLYTLPCSTSDGDGVNVFSKRKSLINKFEKNCLSMKAMGYKSSSFNILSEIEMGASAKAVNIGWRVHFFENDIEFRCLYICHEINNQWLIFSANVYEGSFTA